MADSAGGIVPLTNSGCRNVLTDHLSRSDPDQNQNQTVQMCLFRKAPPLESRGGAFRGRNHQKTDDPPPSIRPSARSGCLAPNGPSEPPTWTGASLIQEIWAKLRPGFTGSAGPFSFSGLQLHVSEGSDPLPVGWPKIGFRGRKGGRRSSNQNHPPFLLLHAGPGAAGLSRALQGRRSRSFLLSAAQQLMEAGSQRRAQFRTLFLFLHLSY